jgi:hypothetical protein
VVQTSPTGRQTNVEMPQVGHHENANLVSSPIYRDGRYCLHDLWGVGRLESSSEKMSSRSYHTFPVALNAMGLYRWYQ